jgi:predicted O-linked N-acetylglucosamine transferase (SPINDLY family)
MPSLQETLIQALQCYQAGNLVSAEEGFRQVVRADPKHAAAWCCLGIVCRSLGKLQEAVDSCRQALVLQPEMAEAHCNLGNALLAQRSLQEAGCCYQRAIQLRPDLVDAHSNLGVALREQGQFDQAATTLRQAIRLKPGHAEAHSALGSVLIATGKWAEAAACCREALRLRPDLADAHDNLGVALVKLGQVDAALSHHQQAIRFKPTAAAYVNYGVALSAHNQLEQAIACYRLALGLQPAFPTAHYNLGVALVSVGRPEEALASLHEALRLKPDYYEAHDRLAHALMLLGKAEEAEKSYREALRLRPGDAQTHSNLLLTLNYLPQWTPAALYAEHQQWDKIHGRVPRLALPSGGERHRDKRLRVGYVSPDFRRHAVASFIEPILANHDPKQVEVIAYAYVAAPDEVTARLRSLAHSWRSISGMSYAQIAQQIRDNQIDILVDLAGHAGASLLPVFAAKPAPVQVTYLGYPNTTGLSTIDYRLTDAIADPPGEPVCHSEERIRLRNGFCCWRPPAAAPTIGRSPAETNGYFTFGSTHNLAKLNGAVFDLWSLILRMAPAARLLIFRDSLTARRQDELRQQFQDRGVAGERICFSPAFAVGNNFLPVYGAIDLFLDAFPFGGHTTVCEALWMGVPVLTLRGNRFAGRAAASVLTQVGLPEFIADTKEQYIALAVDCFRNPERLASYRARLREQVQESPLCDGPGFTRELEQAYRDIWNRRLG